MLRDDVCQISQLHTNPDPTITLRSLAALVDSGTFANIDVFQVPFVHVITLMCAMRDSALSSY